jgi:hypothetical protein
MQPPSGTQNPYGLGGGGIFKPQQPPQTATQPIKSGPTTPQFPGAGQAGKGYGGTPKPFPSVPPWQAGQQQTGGVPTLSQFGGYMNNGSGQLPAQVGTTNPFMPQFQQPLPQPQQVSRNPYNPFQGNWDWNQSGRFPGNRFPSY